MRKKYIKEMQIEVNKYGYSLVAKRIGIDYFQLYRIIKGISKGTIEVWEKIIKFYK
jgi:hypothetical protein